MRYNTDIIKLVRFPLEILVEPIVFQFTKMTSLYQLTEKLMYFELNIPYLWKYSIETKAQRK